MNERLADTMYVVLSAAVLYEAMGSNFILWLTPAVVTFAALMQSVVQVGLTLIQATTRLKNDLDGICFQTV